MPQRAEAVITRSEKPDVNRLRYRSMNLSKVYVEMVKQIVESEAVNDENAE